jgi:hypothetical protein
MTNIKYKSIRNDPFNLALLNNIQKLISNIFNTNLLKFSKEIRHGLKNSTITISTRYLC